MSEVDRLAPYFALVGKYVCIERDATEQERAEGQPPTVGGEGLVAEVSLTSLNEVEVVFDYGYGFVLGRELDGFQVTGVWPDKDIRQQFLRHDVVAGD